MFNVSYTASANFCPFTKLKCKRSMIRISFMLISTIQVSICLGYRMFVPVRWKSKEIRVRNATRIRNTAIQKICMYIQNYHFRLLNTVVFCLGTIDSPQRPFQLLIVLLIYAHKKLSKGVKFFVDCCNRLSQNITRYMFL